MQHLADYIASLGEKGEFYFTSKQAREALDISQESFLMSLVRLRHKKSVVSLNKGFHLILPPEYRVVGCFPASHFISAYMKFLELPYYVCLLSAAEYYGAAHQKPQIFQVMTNKQLRPIKCGKVVIRFIFKKDMEDLPVNIFDVPTGYLEVSSPELTAMDLLCYPKSSGGINHVATILTELVEKIDPIKLLDLAKNSKKIFWVQRLGYILEKIDPIDIEHRDKIIDILKRYIKDINPRYVPLITRKMDEIEKNTDWKVIVNCKIESDI